MRCLLVVAGRTDFSRAAEGPCISQPTLSRRIGQLERAVGVRLLGRAGRTVRLIDAGETHVHAPVVCCPRPDATVGPARPSVRRGGGKS
ncbi:LysR family transcriptional regulator [Streptomyces sp. NPDC001732]